MRRKNIIQIFVLFVLGIAVLISLFAFQLPHMNENKVVQISVIIDKSSTSLWTNTRLGLEQAVNDMNAELRFLTLSEDDNSDEQIKLLDYEISNGADAVIIAPLNPKELEQFINSKKNICPIVCIGASINNKFITVSPDNESVGNELAKAIKSQYNNENIIMLDNSDGKNNIKSRINSAQKTFKDFDIPVKIINIPTYFNENEILNILQKNKNSTIIVFEPYLSEIVAKCKFGNALDINLYTVGSSPYITRCLDSKIINSVAVWSDYAVGYLSAENAINLADNKKTSLKSLTFKIINGDNMYEPENEKILFPVIT